ncbi:uncharacterized protein EDB91DRAFT_1006197, partial [Suillus paluster]|uniref:uncharacterized protein n=1 Tax=Suillus paluster TaxID=48578 RepID=UPI001B8700C7
LAIPEGTTFPKKVHQRPLTPAQQEYLFPVLDEIWKAGITWFIPSDKVKAVTSTVLIQKMH